MNIYPGTDNVSEYNQYSVAVDIKVELKKIKKRRNHGDALLKVDTSDLQMKNLKEN